jgi:hypothetical protein
MKPGDEYCAKALEFLAKAETESSPLMRAEFENLGAAYLRLAEQAERNAKVDVTYEPPAPNLDDPKIEP